MVDMTLTAKSCLGGFTKDYGNVGLSEVLGKSLVSVATPLGNEKKLAAALQKSFKVKRPEVGFSTASKTSGAVVLGMQSDSLFVLFDYDGNDAAGQIAEKLGSAGYYSDQSDSWVIMNINGADARLALERICMIDLHSTVFPVGSVARTVMEHLGTIIYCEDNDSFLVMAARSSAKSLLHALQVSIQNIT